MALAAAALFCEGCDRDRGSPYFGNSERPSTDRETLYINGYSEPEHLDPGKIADTVSAQYVHAMFEGLTTYGPRDLRPVQGVAASWERSEDGRRLRFHLRPDARWSDGRPVTSHDFEYAWKRVLRPATAARSAPDLYPIKNAERYNRGLEPDEAAVGVHAADDLTLDVELERPTPYFLDLTCRAALAPVRRDLIEAFERRGDGDRWVRPENIVVNGPFTLDRWTFRYEIAMKPNPHYWARDTLRLRKVVWLQIDNPNVAMSLYRTAEIDAFGGNVPIAPQHLPLLLKKRDFIKFPLLATTWLEFNTGARPLDDVRVRRALDLAVDKRRLADAIMQGAAVPASHYVPDGTGCGYAEQAAADRAANADPFPEPVHDPARARALLREAGYEIVEEAGGFRTKGFPPLEILSFAGETKIPVALQAMWREHLGIAVELRSMEWKVVLRDLRDGQFQVAATAWFADYNHPLTFLETFASGSPQNWTHWADADFDALLSRASGTVEPRESIRLYRLAEQRALAGMSRLPLFFPAGTTLVKPWVRGYHGNGRGVDLVRWFWIDPAWRDHAGDEPDSVPGALELPPPGKL